MSVRTVLTRKYISYPAPYSFDGLIDELKIYDRALSQEQIAQSYEADKPQSAPSLKWLATPFIGNHDP